MTDHTPADEAPTGKPWWKKKWGIAAIVLGVLIVIAALGDETTTDGDPTAAGSPTEQSTTEPEPTQDPAADETQPPEAPTEDETEDAVPEDPETEQPPAFETVTREGSGDDVVTIDIPQDQPAVASLTHNGSANFSVLTYGPNGERRDLLANVIGGYDGTRPLNFTGNEPVSEFEITADGAWTLEVKPLLEGRMETEAQFSGEGPDVVILAGDMSGRAAVTHDGESNFAVIAWGSGRELLINEIGAYQGAVRVPTGTLVLDIEGDGSWSFDFSS